LCRYAIPVGESSFDEITFMKKNEIEWKGHGMPCPYVCSLILEFLGTIIRV